MNAPRLLFLLGIVLFVTTAAEDALAASRTAFLPDGIDAGTLRSGTSPDDAHPHGTLFGLGSFKGELYISEWDVERAVVVRRVRLGIPDKAGMSLTSGRGPDRFYVGIHGAKNALLVFDGALHPLFSRELPPGDIDEIRAEGNVLAVTSNLHDNHIQLTSIDPTTYADLANVVLDPHFFVWPGDDEMAPCRPRGALRISGGAIYIRTHCFADQTRLFALRPDGHPTTVGNTMTSPAAWNDATLQLHGLTIVLPTQPYFQRPRITWR